MTNEYNESQPQYAYPTSGFEVPQSVQPTYYPVDPTLYANDPIVPAPDERFQGWWARLLQTLGRSWRTLALILAVTFALPSIVVAILTSAVLGSSSDASAGVAFSALGLGLVGFVVITFIQAIGWAAAMWTMVYQAAGTQVELAAALRFGLRRAAAIWWRLLLVGLMVGAGACALIVPGLYLAVATSIVVPIIVFEGGRSSIGRSFSLVNRNFLAAAGRIALLYVPGLVVGVIIEGGILGALTVPGVMPTDFGTVSIAASTLSAVLTIVTQTIMMAGVLITYAQFRGRMWPTRTADLMTSLNDEDPSQRVMPQWPTAPDSMS